MYISTQVSDARYTDKYFIKFHNTHAVRESFKTIKAMMNYIEQM